MRIDRRADAPALITIPSADAAFRAHVQGIRRAAGPAELEARLRRMYPRVVVRERTLSGEAPAWYVYRDGSWRSQLDDAWWEEDGLPRVVVSADGWITEANATALGLLEMAPTELGIRHFTDFIVPGTLDDSLALFRVVEQGHDLNATVLLRPTSGHLIAIDLHARLSGEQIVGVLRLADDVQIRSNAADVVGGPAQVEFMPATDVAFRGYGQRAVARMPEPTTEGLALRLRRLYPHATVEAVGDQWVARREAGPGDGDHRPWWRDRSLPMVRYDTQALILEANEAAQNFFARPMVGHYWQEFVTPGSTEQVTVMLEILAEAGAAESRFRMPRGDGSLMEFDSYTEARGEEFSTVFRPAGGG